MERECISEIKGTQFMLHHLLEPGNHYEMIHHVAKKENQP